MAESPACGACGSWWRLPLLLLLVLLGIMLFRNRGAQELSPEQVDPSSTQPPAGLHQSVLVVVEYGDGNRAEFGPLKWRDGMTVLDVMRELTDGPSIEVRGQGAGAFLESIGGVANEGASGRNWIYSVNGKLADRSFAIYQIAPGDRILWSFTLPQ